MAPHEDYFCMEVMRGGSLFWGLGLSSDPLGAGAMEGMGGRAKCVGEWESGVGCQGLSREGLMSRVLEVTLWDYDKLGTNEFLGEALLDLQATPLTNHPHWHTLSEMDEDSPIRLVPPLLPFHSLLTLPSPPPPRPAPSKMGMPCSRVLGMGMAVGGRTLFSLPRFASSSSFRPGPTPPSCPFFKSKAPCMPLSIFLAPQTPLPSPRPRFLVSCEAPGVAMSV